MDNDDLYTALTLLQGSIEKQTEIQEQLLATMKALIGTLEENSQASADLQQAIEKK